MFYLATAELRKSIESASKGKISRKIGDMMLCYATSPSILKKTHFILPRVFVFIYPQKKILRINEKKVDERAYDTFL